MISPLVLLPLALAGALLSRRKVRTSVERVNHARTKVAASDTTPSREFQATVDAPLVTDGSASQFAMDPSGQRWISSKSQSRALGEAPRRGSAFAALRAVPGVESATSLRTVDVREGALTRSSLAIVSKPVNQYPGTVAPSLVAQQPPGVLDTVALRVGGRYAPPLPRDVQALMQLFRGRLERVRKIRALDGTTWGALVDEQDALVTAFTEAVNRNDLESASAIVGSVAWADRAFEPVTLRRNRSFG